MSNQQGGPPGGPAPPAGTYGPGQTVLGVPVFTDDGQPAPSVGMPIPPTTVRDGSLDTGAPAYPPSPPAYGTPGSPYGGSDAGFDPGPPLPVLPPPPPARGRGRGRGRGTSGAAMVVIGLVSFVVIGGGVTALVLLRDAGSDDKPVPTVEVPAAASAPPGPGPGAPGAPTDQPSAAPPPSTPSRSGLPARPGRPGRPGPGNSNGPNGPYNPRYSPRRPR